MKRNYLRYARLSAAVAGVLFGAAHMAHAQTLTWDASGAVPPTDGSGNWDTTSQLWYNGAAATSWSNGDTAVFGNPNSSAASATGPSYAVSLNAPNITAQNIVLGTSSDSGYYSIYDQGTPGGQTLTLDGNLVKASAVGESVILLSNPMLLSAGNHVVSINDTPGPVPELSMDNSMVETGGSASITVNNAAYNSNYDSYGTFVLNAANTYSGGTNILDGIITDNANGALGSGTVSIGTLGCLAIGGNNTTAPSSLTISNPILITRNDYTDPNYSDNPGAIISQNDGVSQTVTFNGPFVIDSNDAQVVANTSTIVIASSLSIGPDITPSSALLQFSGDTAGYAELTANNTAYAAAGGTIGIGGNVELNVTAINEIGGATGNILMDGGDIHPVGGVFTSFGSLNVNYPTFNGGIDVDPNETFTISQNVGGVNDPGGSLSERGAGTLNISGTDTLGGTSFWDGWSASPTGGGVTGGVINVSGDLLMGSLRLRSPTVNVTGTLTLTGNSYNSFGEDSNGTFGGPDEATVNITGTGTIDETSNNDFNISDNANTTCTINISGSGSLTTNGNTYLGKSAGGVGVLNITGNGSYTNANANQLTELGVNSDSTGTINQSGGSITIDRNGNFGFVIADGRNAGGGSPVGTYNFSAGSFTDENGEIYVGEGTNNGNPGIGYWTQTGGNATFGDWFVVGREGAMGTVVISGNSTFTKDPSDPGSNVSVGEGGANVCSFTVEGNAVANIESGQMYAGNNSSVGIVNVGSATDPVNSAPSLTVNNWFAVGRNGTSNGTLNVYDGSFTDNNFVAGAGTNYFDISGDGGNPTGTVNVYGGSVTAGQTLVGENGSGVATVNISGGVVNLGAAVLANANSVTGIINLNGGTLEGTFAAHSGELGEGNGNGTDAIYFNGGTLSATGSSADDLDASLTSLVSTGGAIVNPAGNSITINSALTHNSAIAGADGGLTVNGAGTVVITGADTYTGATKVSAGTLVVGANGALPTGASVALSSTGTLQLGTGTGLATISSLAISGSGVFDITNNHAIITYGSSDPIATIRGYLKSGYNNGGWNGTDGIISSTAQTLTNGLRYGVGWADGNDGVHDVAGLSSGEIELKYTLLGDANLDGTVNGSDFSILAANFGLGVTNWDQGNFLYSSSVNGSDFSALAANFGQGDSGADASITPADIQALDSFAVANGLPVPTITAVPEPASIGLLALGGIVAMRRRRKA
jgi:autotransporter-associated beta strand protein